MTRKDYIVTELKEIKEDIKHLKEVSIPDLHKRINIIAEKKPFESDNKQLYRILELLAIAVITLAGGKILNLLK